MFEAGLLKGQSILITGGGTGLGRAMALRCAELGAKVFLAARREEPLRETAEEIRKKGGAAAWGACDVRDFAAVEKVIEQAEKEVGPVTALVNNAAGNFVCPTERLSPNAFASVVGIVLNGSFHATLALTRSLAVEWARYKIRLNAIAPGAFPTEGAWGRVIPSAEYEEHHRRRHPMQRFGRHEELANLAVFLLSPQAGYINGDCVTIDGGQWLRQGGQFNDLLEVPDALWDEMEKARKKAK